MPRYPYLRQAWHFSFGRLPMPTLKRLFFALFLPRCNVDDHRTSYPFAPKAHFSVNIGDTPLHDLPSVQQAWHFPSGAWRFALLSELSLVSFRLGAILRKTIPTVFRTTKAFLVTVGWHSAPAAFCLKADLTSIGFLNLCCGVVHNAGLHPLSELSLVSFLSVQF